MLAVKMLLAFQKGDMLRHLGHLDLQRAMHRALRRSGLPVRYSRGFHPHILVSFASALAVGVSSDEEIAEVALDMPEGSAGAEDCLARMNAVLPEALRAVRAVLVEDSYPALMEQLKQAGYTAWLPGAGVSALSGSIRGFLSETQVMATRVTKRGEALVNIRPMVHELTVTGEERGARLDMRLSLEESATLKPGLLISVLWERAGLLAEEMPVPVLRRTGLFGLRNGIAVPLLPV